MAYPPKPFQVRWVALLAEGVDRNAVFVFTTCVLFSVALLAEGVDRNAAYTVRLHPVVCVALLAEGVDRNTTYCTTRSEKCCRPPRGGRG